MVGTIIGTLIGLILGLILGFYLKIILRRYLKIEKKEEIYYYSKEKDFDYTLKFTIDHIGEYVDIKFIQKDKYNQYKRKYVHPQFRYNFYDILDRNINGTGKNKYIYQYFYSYGHIIKNKILKYIKMDNIKVNRLSDNDVLMFIEHILRDNNVRVIGWTSTEQEIDLLLDNFYY